MSSRRCSETMEARLHTRSKPLRESFTMGRSAVLQRKCACGGTSGIKGACQACDQQKLSLQRSALDSTSATHSDNNAPASVYGVLRSPGQPLDTKTRGFFEPRFGHDFSHVRVHTDPVAAESASQVNALAYTFGRNIVFGTNQFAPETATGRQLLAHELTHVAQQVNQNDLPAGLEVGPPVDAFERQADEVAAQICSAESPAASSPISLRAESGMKQQIIHRAVEQPEPHPPAPRAPEPPVDCTKEITPDHDCAKLIAEMIALAADMRDNDRWLDDLNKQLQEDPMGVPLDVWAARTKQKVALQKDYQTKERIRLACCPTFEVPPEAPTFVSPDTPTTPAPP
jgi:hypothetical protein